MSDDERRQATIRHAQAWLAGQEEHPGERDEWLQVRLQAPAEVGRALLEFLEQRFGYREIAPIDWCRLERPEDYSWADWAPCEPAGNQYKVDWRKGEDRGDIPVNPSDPSVKPD